ncbi:MAG: DNA repair protein RadC [Bacteroidaceae bacterium]|nr:DNA repair protein RadC [Bacteroidaceae bacterium]MBO7589866.1 DNA repair protein RadC [Bacteroidaceae bacterium]
MDKPDKLNLKQWAVEDRPREKMRQKGASALTNAELLAILIHTGNTEDSVVALTQKVMASCRNSLSELGKLSVGELCSFKGIGEAKAITILAACELGRRRREEEPLRKPVIRTSRDIYDWFYPMMSDMQVEECHVLFLNQAAKVLDSMRVSLGGLTGASVDVRCILRETFLQRATAIALCHNHPSGNLIPSRADDELTQSVMRACRAVDIQLIDHVIFTDGGYYSYADKGRL